jgi:hypothetical protein
LTNALDALLLQLEQDRSLDAPDRLRERLDALDRLDACLSFEQGEGGDAESAAKASLDARAGALSVRLEAVNATVYQAIRSELRQGRAPGWLLEQIAACSRGEGGILPLHDEGYDYLDAAVAGILQFGEPDAEIGELADEMVFYQPTPARHVFDLIGRAAFTERDVLVDLGSGLGHVPLLVSVCTKARGIGIEYEAAYVECARQCAAALNISRATFVRQDAREADFSCGTLFYLYTPFSGGILRTVLDALRREAARRVIRIATYGPCTRVVAAEPWLAVEGTLQSGRLALFRSDVVVPRG